MRINLKYDFDIQYKLGHSKYTYGQPTPETKTIAGIRGQITASVDNYIGMKGVEKDQFFVQLRHGEWLHGYNARLAFPARNRAFLSEMNRAGSPLHLAIETVVQPLDKIISLEHSPELLSMLRAAYPEFHGPESSFIMDAVSAKVVFEGHYSELAQEKSKLLNTSIQRWEIATIAAFAEHVYSKRAISIAEAVESFAQLPRPIRVTLP